ncbi:hypothetical protein SLS62_010613 [Diatrype stigma]|uniref:Cellobiose dehydrogenase-like cytochrome domain-containing protein n=1 Tax=Diatrype stigma TaxID=117547 RepID=A0AAN9YGQ4_9PEZI
MASDIRAIAGAVKHRAPVSDRTLYMRATKRISPIAQDSVPTTDEETGISFQTYTSAEGVSFGLALPADAGAEGGYDIIVQITAPIDIGWAGIAWGGAMVYNPLSVVWANGESVIASPRTAYGYYQPEIYTDGSLELLKGSSANATHYKVTALAKGYSTWTDFDGNVANLDGSAQVRFAYAYSTTPVDDPTSVESTFSIHDSVGRWVHDLAAARSESFADWVEANTVTAPPSNGTAGGFAQQRQRALRQRAPLSGNGTVAREERHPLIPQLRDSAKFITRRQANETAHA